MKSVKHIASFLLSIGFFTTVWGQAGSKFRVIGGARSIVSNNRIEVFDSIPDNTTAKANNGGYALFDLGFDITPNKNTEILGMFRINNQYGGFYGAGVTFDIRQLWIKGIIADVVRYQLGDINVKQTPFTLYNHNEDQTISMPKVFDLQRQIVNYESFYKDNSWRQQGLSLDWGLEFNSPVKEINFNGYLLRLNATNFAQTSERLMGGGTVEGKFGEHVVVAYNLASIFDVSGTALNNQLYHNTVQTGSFKYSLNPWKIPVKLEGEFGTSAFGIDQDTLAPELNDYFVHSAISSQSKNKESKYKWNFKLGYLNVGPDFRSPGAQSKRIDYSTQPGLFNRYKQSQMDRPISWGDAQWQIPLYRIGISTKLMDFNYLVNPVLPYGIATFNRQGIYVDGSVNLGSVHNTLNVSHYELSEIRGQGTEELRKFRMSKLELSNKLGNYFHWNRTLNLTHSISYQSSRRNSNFEFEQTDYQLIQGSTGLEWEFSPKLEWLVGYTLSYGKGNETRAERNIYAEIVDFKPIAIDQRHSVFSTGMRCNFGENAYLAVIYQSQQYQDFLKSFDKYAINQWLIIYNLTF